MKIGNSEGAATVAISMLPIFIYKYLGDGISKINGAFWINFIVSAVIVFLVMNILQKGLSFHRECNNKIIFTIFNSVFLIYIISFSLYTLYLGIDMTEYIFSEPNSRTTVLYFSLFAACFSSMCGIEALSRSVYVIFHAVCLIILIMCVISFRGWTLMNFVPLFGNDINSTFLPSQESVVPFLGLISLGFMANYYKDTVTVGSFCKRSFIIFFLLSLSIALLCTLCTPYPMGEYYSFSLGSIFSLADSGVFFHSFEIFLLIFVVIINISAFSFGLHISSECICKLFSLCDNKPFIMILSLLFFCTISLFKLKEYLFFIYIVSSVVLIFYLAFFSLFFKLRRINEIH